MAAIPDDGFRRAFARTSRLGYVPESPFGLAAMFAAYTEPSVEEWRERLVEYLRANRDHIAQELAGSGLKYTHPEATYLTW